MFIEIARQVYRETGELSSISLADFSKNRLQTGMWSYTAGHIMQEYRYTPETLPDPQVGPGYFAFPVVEYLEGESMILFPNEWARPEPARAAGEDAAEETEPSPPEEPAHIFTVGVLGPFSGRSAPTGVEMRGAVEMALEAIGSRIGP